MAIPRAAMPLGAQVVLLLLACAAAQCNATLSAATASSWQPLRNRRVCAATVPAQDSSSRYFAAHSADAVQARHQSAVVTPHAQTPSTDAVTSSSQAWSSQQATSRLPEVAVEPHPRLLAGATLALKSATTTASSGPDPLEAKSDISSPSADFVGAADSVHAAASARSAVLSAASGGAASADDTARRSMSTTRALTDVREDAVDDSTPAASRPAGAAAVRCVGHSLATRACHFRHLRYDRETQRFVHFSALPATAGQPSPDEAAHLATFVARATAADKVHGASAASDPGQPVTPFLQLGGYVSIALCCTMASASSQTTGRVTHLERLQHTHMPRTSNTKFHADCT